MCPNRGAAPTGVPPLPGLHCWVGILPAVDTAGYRPFAAPRLHHTHRMPPYADLPPILRCTPQGLNPIRSLITAVAWFRMPRWALPVTFGRTARSRRKRNFRQGCRQGFDTNDAPKR